MSQWPRNAMSLYVALAVHAIALLALGLTLPSQDMVGNESGLKLASSTSAAVGALLSAVPEQLLDETSPAAAGAEHVKAGSAPDGTRRLARDSLPRLAGASPEATTASQAQASSAPLPQPAPSDAAPPATAGTSGPDEPGPATAAGGGGLDHYFSRLRQHLARHVGSMPIEWQGAEVVVGFDLEHDGSATRLRIAGPSGIPEMDAAALEWVARASPFPRPPKEATGSLLVPIGAGRNR